MKILSLFSGVGGLDNAVETLLGTETAILCERDEYARKVLARHWPGVPCVDDVTQVGDVGADVICGGPPCQDVSVAGKQAAEKGTRWLWPEAVRVTAANRPRLCLWENVPGLLTADSGRAFAGVLRAFDEIGYATRWDHCEAAAAGAPHRRDRVFLVCVPVDRFTPPGPVAGRPVSLFGHADEPEWPRAGWYAAGVWGVERARWPRGAAAVAWPTPKANDKTASDTMPQDVRDYREARGCLDAVAQGVVTRNWPTPDAGAANLNESSESWHARAATLKEKHGNGNGAGTPLAVAVRDADADAEGALWVDPRNPDHVRRMVPTRKGDQLRPETSEEYWRRQPPADGTGKVWPTPQAHDQKGKPGADSLAYAGLASSLPASAEVAVRDADAGPARAWPHNAEKSNAPGALKLDHAVWEATGDARAVKWPTPVLNDGTKEGTGTLAREVQCGGSHTRRDGGERSTPPTGQTGNSASTTGALNPAFSEWLQGFPPGWTEQAGEAMPHVAAGWTDVPLTYYGGRPAPAGMALLTTHKTDRRNRLKCMGNAVVARCAILALGALIPPNVLAEVE